jgi:prevent-host-death family protein
VKRCHLTEFGLFSVLMSGIRISENFVPISEFKAQAADWLRKIDETDAPVIVTQNGKPAGVLLSPRAYDALTEQARFVDAVNEGLADVQAGRTHTHAEVVERMNKRFRRK